jgi:uncharacterized protein (DUF58 family)
MDIPSTIQEILAGLEQVGIQVPWLTSTPAYTGSERDSKIDGQTGFDIAGVKEWEPGERLDHRTTARTGWRTHYTLVFEEARELTVFVLAEDSPSVDFGMVNQTKKQLTATLMASILSNAACTSELAGYGIWSGPQLKQFRGVEPAGRQLLPAINAYLDPEAEIDDTDPAAESGMGQALLRLPVDRRCLVFVISDCLGSRSAADQEALEYAAGMHDLVFLVVGDLRERELPGKGRGFRDIEDLSSGQTMSVLLTDKTRKQWRDEFDRHRHELRKGLSDLGIAMEEFYTNETGEQLSDKLLPIYAGIRP